VEANLLLPLALTTACLADRLILLSFCSVLEGAIRELQISCSTWQSLLQSCNTATDAGFRVKHEGRL